MWFFLAFFAKKLERLIPQYWNFLQREIRCFRKNLENKILIVAAVDAQLLIGFWRSDQSQSTTPGQPTNAMEPQFSNISYLKQLMPKKRGAEVLILPNS